MSHTISKLKVALQMDPVEDIDINGDSTFVLGLEAIERGHDLFHYLPESLIWNEAIVMARMAPLVLRRDKANHYTLGDYQLRPVSDMNIIWMRQDPPFDMAYITATHLLDLVHPKTYVVNNPSSVRNAPEKLFVTQFSDLMPATLITRSYEDVVSFQNIHGDLVIKPLFGNGGAGVFHVEQGSPNVSSLMEMFTTTSREPVMVQKFLSKVTDGDKRIILIDGEVAGAINRIPAKGQIRSNMVVGGKAVRSSLSQKEEEICRRLKPSLQKLDLIFVGIDVIDGFLTEINVTSPTGLQSINRYDSVCLQSQIWDVLEDRFLKTRG